MEKIRIVIDLSTGQDCLVLEYYQNLFKKLIAMQDIFDLRMITDSTEIDIADLCLSSSKKNVSAYNDLGITSCFIDTSKPIVINNTESSNTITFAFDCDCVLFDSEAEDVYKQYGLEAFNGYEYANRDNPMRPGPFYRLIKKLNKIKKVDNRIKLVACTARSYPANERALHTFDVWNIDFDAIFFCGSNSKGDVLLSVDTDIFFDDNIKNVEDAVSHGVLAGQVV